MCVYVRENKPKKWLINPKLLRELRSLKELEKKVETLGFEEKRRPLYTSIEEKTKKL